LTPEEKLQKAKEL